MKIFAVRAGIKFWPAIFDRLRQGEAVLHPPTVKHEQCVMANFDQFGFRTAAKIFPKRRTTGALQGCSSGHLATLPNTPCVKARASAARPRKPQRQ